MSSYVWEITKKDGTVVYVRTNQDLSIVDKQKILPFVSYVMLISGLEAHEWKPRKLTIVAQEQYEKVRIEYNTLVDMLGKQRPALYGKGHVYVHEYTDNVEAYAARLLELKSYLVNNIGLQLSK